MVISLFDFSGNLVSPWAEAGYDCFCYDIQHPSAPVTVRRGAGSITKMRADLSEFPMAGAPRPGTVAFVAAFPPCDHLAVSGARWFVGKGLRKLAHSINLFATAAEYCEAAGAPYFIENPVSTISTYWRKPDHAFDPCDYGDPYTKKTCLWTGGGFVMPPKCRVEPTLGSKMHLLPPSADRANKRSETPMGFARAVFLANAPHLIKETV